MTDRERLIAAGEALYGRIWQAQMSELLDIDGRRLRAWIAGERSIPPGIWPEIAAELWRRGEVAVKLAAALEKQTSA